MAPQIETDRLFLTIPAVEAAAHIASYVERNADFHRPWSPRLDPLARTTEFWQKRLAQDNADFHDGRALRLCILERSDPQGTIVGRIIFDQIIRGVFEACYVGFDLDERVISRGYMTEALRGALPYVFAEMKLHRVMANYRPANERSGAVLRRLGFVVEGFARDYLRIDGQWRDHILTSLTSGMLHAGE